jgi:copine 5/8/9
MFRRLAQIVRASEVLDGSTSILFHANGKKLDKKDFLGKSDPYIKIYRTNKDGTTSLVHQTETKMNTLDPTWQPFKIPLHKLNEADPERPIVFEVFDWDKVGSHGPSDELIAVSYLNYVFLCLLS